MHALKGCLIACVLRPSKLSVLNCIHTTAWTAVDMYHQYCSLACAGACAADARSVCVHVSCIRPIARCALSGWLLDKLQPAKPDTRNTPSEQRHACAFSHLHASLSSVVVTRGVTCMLASLVCILASMLLAPAILLATTWSPGQCCIASAIHISS